MYDGQIVIYILWLEYYYTTFMPTSEMPANISAWCNTGLHIYLYIIILNNIHQFTQVEKTIIDM